MKAGFIQTPRIRENQENVEAALKEIESLDADLVVLPELFSTGYQFRTKEEALCYRAVDGIRRRRRRAAKKRRYIVAGFAEKSGKRPTTHLCSSGPGVLSVYTGRRTLLERKNIFSRGTRPPL
jgi:predicted amidohydrolase